MYIFKIFATIQSLPCRLNIHGVRKSLVSANIPICKPESSSKSCSQNSLDNLHLDHKIVAMNQFISGKMLLKLSYHE